MMLSPVYCEMPANVPPDPVAAAAAEAAAAAARASLVRLWTLFSVGVSVTILRTYARSRAVGITNLRADDFLVWIAIVRATRPKTQV
ncbi:hypothetical protein SLS62_002529 [Diatrype stigma]|uniref:Uncharacterized protein n=1 Tax=Diatrype stigma TaxID=117547 RepID=A0AAN9V6T7_9PEZI